MDFFRSPYSLLNQNQSLLGSNFNLNTNYATAQQITLPSAGWYEISYGGVVNGAAATGTCDAYFKVIDGSSNLVSGLCLVVYVEDTPQLFIPYYMSKIIYFSAGQTLSLQAKLSGTHTGYLWYDATQYSQPFFGYRRIA